jgi:DNA-directed RNA polymerase subunit RPC12/RpoP
MSETPAPPPEAIVVSPDGNRQFPCAKCGAKLNYEPGTTSLTCPYCGHENPINLVAEPVVEHDYEAQIAEMEHASPVHEALTVKCGACGAEVSAPADATAFPCPYCGTNIVAVAHSTKQIKPGALLPFRVKREQARDAFRKWIRSRWFAPNALKRQAGIDQSIAGMYMPYWTYDCRTVTVNGRTEHRTRQVRHIRWTPASGVVSNSFDDVLVAASNSLPREKVDALAPWDLKDCVPYQDDYLSGFRAESYQIDLPGGFAIAKTIMEPTIRSTVRADIGGDEQRIDRMNVNYKNIYFKHLLLPVWVSAYRYKSKVYRFLVNARTGEVQGDRPYSAAKITTLVIAILVVIGVIAFLASR